MAKLDLDRLVGSRAVKFQAYSQNEDSHKLWGRTLSAAEAFDDAAWDFLGKQIFDAFDVEYEDDKALGRATRKTLRDIGIHPAWKAFEWCVFEVSPDERGKGFGRATVERLEGILRKKGVRVVILQAGNLGDEHSLEFWEKMGYEAFELDYGWYDDKLMWKRL